MKRFMDIFIDTFAFPVRFFEKLTDNKITLALGIILVGAIDLLLPDVPETFKVIFSERSAGDIRFNAVMMVIVILALGIVDVVFVGVPLFDIFRYLKKKETAMAVELSNQINASGENEGEGNPLLRLKRSGSDKNTASYIKVMKVYIMSHFVIVPVSTLLYYVFTRDITVDSASWQINLYMIIFMGISLWSAGVISRGINALFRFNLLFMRLTFIIVFIWNFIFSSVFSAQIMKWVFMLFR